MRENARHWHKLDNTANLFPVISSHRYSNVYRVALTLKQPVRPEILQQALCRVLPWFPNFCVRLRRGLFWHFLEENNEEPQVYREDGYPCHYIDPMQNRHFLFRVSYFEYRINLEVFHVLTDGNAAKDFLLAMVCQYLMMAYPQSFCEDDTKKRWFAEHASEVEDSYLKNYDIEEKKSYRIGKAYKIKGERSLLGSTSVFHVHIDLEQFRTLCNEKNASRAQYLAAVIGWAVCKQRPGIQKRLPVHLFMPVDLRKMFNSKTALNFFSNVFIRFPYSEDVEFETVLEDVKQQFAEKVNRESMLSYISYTTATRGNPFIRAMPLPIKMAALRTVFTLSSKSTTLSFTSLGDVKVPKQFEPYITGATLLLSCAPKEPFKCAAVLYQNDFVFSMSSTLRSMDIQRTIIRKLAQDGLNVTVETNGVDYASM